MKLREGNVFTGVCHSIHKGRGMVGISGTRSLVGVNISMGYVRGWICPEGVSGGWVSGGVGTHPRYMGPRILCDMMTSRWYASYWNAFLSIIVKLDMCVREYHDKIQYPTNGDFSILN